MVILCLLQSAIQETALVTAVGRGHLHIIETLVQNGASVNYRTKVWSLIITKLIESKVHNSEIVSLSENISIP